VFSGTVRARPNATVWAVSGIRCNLGGFLGEHRRGFAPRHPVLTVVHLIHERLTGCLEFGEGAVVAAEIGVLRHEVGFGELHGRFNPALGGRVCGLAGQHRDPVVPGEVQGLLVPDRDPGNMGRGDGLLVVSQHVGRCPAQDPEAPVQGREDARRRPVPQRNHDPEAGERQPGNEQDGLHPADPGPVAEVVLQPHPRLGDPRPVNAGVAQPPPGLHLGDRPAGGPFRTRVAQGEELFVGLVGTDPALR
jgi:hypothetical protein